MFQNIKTDIIYYKTNTDFEMEFNLCGCCRMRLLTDKASDRKTLIADLSRAVSRSRIILVVGALFGDDNIISNIAEAIGKKLSPADNKTYGIDSSEEIAIISGATPLVTEDGIFGGCIIESGPQTMILLSDSKNIRKSIMNNLIHPYIEDIYAVELTGNTPVAEVAEETAAEEETVAEEPAMEAIKELPEEASEDVVEEQAETEAFEDGTDLQPEENESVQETAETQLILEDEAEVSGGMVFETEDEIYEAEEDTVELFAEAKKIRRREAKYYNEAYGDFELDDAGLIGDDGFGEPYYIAPPFTRIAVLVIAVLVLIALAVLCYCIFYVPSKDGISAAAYIKDIYNTLFG